MNIQEMIRELKGCLQALEDSKTQITEQQEIIREMIARLLMELASREAARE